MKRHIVQILLLLLILSTILSFSKINNLQRQLESFHAEVNDLRNSAQEDINTIYANVDEMLKQKASLIESATTDIGAVNVEEVTVPITFTLTPKEVSESTTVTLNFTEESFPMERNGDTFFTTVSRGVFEDVLPKIIINESGLKKITQDDRISVWNMKETIFPTFMPSFGGDMSYGDNTFKRKGMLIASNNAEVSEVKFTSIRLVTAIDNEVISDEVIPRHALLDGYELDEETTVGKGQVYTMKVLAKDSIGFEHHYIVDQWVGGANAHGEIMDHEQIYSADGKLLWETHYE